MVNDPFEDKTPGGSMVVSRGSIRFFPVALTVNDVLSTPDTVAFAIASPKVVQILDPDGADVTSAWATVELDSAGVGPSGAADTYDAAHSTYVGAQNRSVGDGVTTNGSTTLTSATANFTSADVGKSVAGSGIPSGTKIAALISATQVTMGAAATATASGVSVTIGAAYLGLFHNGAGRIAQKVKVPPGAEITVGTARTFKIKWNLLKAGSNVPAEETFHVQAAGALVFDLETITVAEVRDEIKTDLADADIEDIIESAANFVEGRLDALRIDVDDFATLPPLVRHALVQAACWKVFLYDASAFRKIPNLREGNKAAAFAGNSNENAEMYRKWAIEDVEAYAAEHGKKRKTRVKVSRQLPGDGAFTQDGNPSAVLEN